MILSVQSIILRLWIRLLCEWATKLNINIPENARGDTQKGLWEDL